PFEPGSSETVPAGPVDLGQHRVGRLPQQTVSKGVLSLVGEATIEGRDDDLGVRERPELALDLALVHLPANQDSDAVPPEYFAEHTPGAGNESRLRLEP